MILRKAFTLYEDIQQDAQESFAVSIFVGLQDLNGLIPHQRGLNLELALTPEDGLDTFCNPFQP